MFQSLQCLLVFAFVTLHGDVNTGVPQVVRHANFSHSDHRQARIFKFESDNLRDLFTQCLRDSFGPVHTTGGSRQEAVGRRQEQSVSCRPQPASCGLEFSRRHSLNNVGLDLVADFDVVEVFQTDTALETLANLGDVILEAAQ